MCDDSVYESVLVSGYTGQVVSWLECRSKRIWRSMSRVHSSARVCPAGGGAVRTAEAARQRFLLLCVLLPGQRHGRARVPPLAPVRSPQGVLASCNSARLLASHTDASGEITR